MTLHVASPAHRRRRGSTEFFGRTASEREKYGLVEQVLSSAEMGDRLATIDVGQKLRRPVPLFGGLVPHLTQCGQGRSLPPRQVSS